MTLLLFQVVCSQNLGGCICNGALVRTYNKYVSKPFCVVARSLLVYLENVTEALFCSVSRSFLSVISRFHLSTVCPLQVGGVVETNRPDTKNAQYQACIKQGDLLLNRVQKLGRVVEA